MCLNHVLVIVFQRMAYSLPGCYVSFLDTLAALGCALLGGLAMSLLRWIADHLAMLIPRWQA